MKKIIALWIILLITLQAGTTGKITGRITDATNGEPIFGASVIIVGTTQGAATDVDGNFVILNVRPGVYTLRITSIGYNNVVVEEVRVAVDQTTQVSAQLTSTDITMDEVVVTATTPLVQKDQTGSISVMTRDEIESLPVASFTDILGMQAGVVSSNGGLNIRGGRSNEVAYMVDGMYVQDPLLGGLATSISNDAIQELSLLSGTFNAEYGNALSGIVNIVTRDGSDEFSGKIEARTSEFGIEDYSKLHENRINGNFSGPIVPGSLRFFISGEQDNRGSYLPFGFRTDQTFFTKLSFTGIPSMKFTFANRGSKSQRRSYSHAYKYIPEQYSRTFNDSWQSTLSLTHTLGSNLFYDLRVSYFNQGYYTGLRKDTSEYLSSAEFEYVANAGNGFEFYSKANPLQLTDSRTVTIDAKFDLVWQLDKTNEIKTGAQYKQHTLKLFSVFDPKRNFPYKNNYNSEPFEASAYIQDKIELDYLVINLGLRFDYMNANASFREDPLKPGVIVSAKPRTQISPRIGIAHPISDRTKLHFAYGHFFQNPEYQYLFENSQYDLNVREPLFGQPNLDATRTVAYEVGLTHQFTDRIAMSLTAYYKDITGLIGTRYYFPFVDGRYTGYTLYVNEDYANVKGFEINLDARASKYFSGGLSYTFSQAKGSASSETEQYPGTQESTRLYYLDFDKTHIINASLSLRYPEDDGPEVFGAQIFENTDLTVIMQASSGFPYTPGGRDIGFVERNSLRMPATYSVDVEVGKEFPLSKQFGVRIFAEILNITDHKNIYYVYPDTGEPDVTYVGLSSQEYIKDPSNLGPGRSIRLGFSFLFN